MNERGENMKSDIIIFMLYAVFSFFIVVIDDLIVTLQDDIKNELLIVLNLMVFCISFSIFLKPFDKHQLKKEWWIYILGVIPLAVSLIGMHLGTFHFVYPERFSFMSDTSLKLHFLGGFILYIILFSVILKIYRLFYEKNQSHHVKIDDESIVKEEKS